MLGEGPVWVEREGALYWLDIKGRKIFRLGGEADVRSWETPFRIGSLAPRDGGGFIAGTERGIALVDPDRASFEIVADPEADLPDNRFNDGKVDRQGRFWAGSMDDKEQAARGTLYRIDPDLTVTPVDRDYCVTNGPAFSPSGDVMYHNDSARRVTYAFDLDRDGTATGRREFARYGDGDGYPDGMTVDCEGGLWIAFWDGWCVRRYLPDGQCTETVKMPVSRPTSCAFGGINLDVLYITSARAGLDSQQLAKQPQAGGLFMAAAGVKGIAERAFAG